MTTAYDIYRTMRDCYDAQTTENVAAFVAQKPNAEQVYWVICHIPIAQTPEMLKLLVSLNPTVLTKFF